MKLSDIADNAGSRKNRMRIGRGIGSGMGKTGGRGGKGQTARTGYRNKGFEGGQMPLHRRLPKRGFRNTPFALSLNEVNLGKVQAAIDAGQRNVGAEPIDEQRADRKPDALLEFFSLGERAEVEIGRQLFRCRNHRLLLPPPLEPLDRDVPSRRDIQYSRPPR